MRTLPAAALMLALLAPARDAAAQSPPTGADVALEMTVAKTLLEEGKKLFFAGRFSEAKEKLEASIRNDPSPAALLALGVCQEKLGATASAWGEFQRAAQQARLQEDKVAEEEATRRAAARGGPATHLSRGAVTGGIVSSVAGAALIGLGIGILINDDSKRAKGVTSIRLGPVAADNGIGVGLRSTW